MEQLELTGKFNFGKKSPDQNLMGSLFRCVAESDNNAVLVLDLLSSEYDPKQIGKKIETAVIDGETVCGNLNFYLFSVFTGALKTAEKLLQYGLSPNQYSDICPEIWAPVQSQNYGISHTVMLANDVCWALLSDEKTALSGLLKVLEKNGNTDIFDRINERTATTRSVASMEDNSAKFYKPLDIAVMYYFAQRMAEQKPEQELFKQMVEVVGQVKELSEVEDINGFRISQNYYRYSADTADKILELINAGATGSENAYFPVCDESIASPFYNGSKFEQMSLRDFCEMNRHLMSPAMNPISDKITCSDDRNDDWLRPIYKQYAKQTLSIT